MMDSNITCDEDSNTTCDEESNTTYDENSNTTCNKVGLQHVMRIDLVQGGTTVKEDGGEEVDILLSRPGCRC